MLHHRLGPGISADHRLDIREGDNGDGEDDGRHSNEDDVNDNDGARPGRGTLQCPGRQLVISRDDINVCPTMVVMTMMRMMGVMAMGMM